MSVPDGMVPPLDTSLSQPVIVVSSPFVAGSVPPAGRILTVSERERGTREYWSLIINRIVATASFPQRPSSDTIASIIGNLHVPPEHENIIANPTIASYVAILRTYDRFIARTGRPRVSADSIKAHLEDELSRSTARSTLTNKLKRLSEFILRANGSVERVVFRVRPADRQQLNRFDNRGLLAADAVKMLQTSASLCYTPIAGEFLKTAQIRFLMVYLCFGAGLRTLEAKRLTVIQIMQLARGDVVKIVSSKKKSGLRETVRIMPFLLTTVNSRHHLSVLEAPGAPSVSGAVRRSTGSIGDCATEQLRRCVVHHLHLLFSHQVTNNSNSNRDAEAVAVSAASVDDAHSLEQLINVSANVPLIQPLFNSISANGLAKSFKALLRVTLGRGKLDGAGVKRNQATRLLETSSRGVSFRCLRKSFMKIMAHWLHTRNIDHISTMNALRTYSRHENENQLRVYLQNESSEENLDDLMEWFESD